MDKDELLEVLKLLTEASATITNIDNTSGYYRKQGDWDRLKTRVRQSRELIKRNEEDE